MRVPPGDARGGTAETWVRESPRLSVQSRASATGPARGAPEAPELRKGYAVNELPQPQPPVAFGFLKVKPDPCMDDT